MEPDRDWTRIIRRMEQLLRLKSFPVAFKMLATESELENIAYMRRMEHKVTLCQLINLVRNFDWTVGAVRDDFIMDECPAILGLCDLPAYYKDGTFRSIVWVKTKQDGERFEKAIQRLPLGRYAAVAMAPLVYNPFEPDIVLVYANPAQMILLINALQFEKYEVMEFYCVGESSCSDAIARCYNDGKPSLSIPCYGERRYGHARDEDLVMALPADALPRALAGLEALYRRGVRYPICPAGAEMDSTPVFPPAYTRLAEVMGKVRGDDNRLVVGVTGGIASGKTTVSQMLTELGAPLIDFDRIARQVVEPGTPALAQIVEYFGRQVLGDDGTLDRKKLSGIVFADIEKRKKLEGLTHPAIYEEFFKQLAQITAEDPDAVIQVAIPLLLELNLQHLFDRLVVVYIPREDQIKRLAGRDGISEAAAAEMLKAQLPIEEKTGYADFVIDNRGSLEDTRRQVEAMWRRLQDIQAERSRPAQA